MNQPGARLPGDDEWRPLDVGTVLKDRYTVKSLLGRGGFGATYCASDYGRFGSQCAVKEFVPSSDDDPDGVLRFQREALALLDLSHEGIPRLHEFFEDQGRYFLVQDLAEGEDLSSIVGRRGSMSEAKTVLILDQLLDILDYLHRYHPPIVHRDVKPANIILSSDNRVQLVDFGAARDVAPGDPTVSVIYTPGYAPLAQMMGKVTPSVDLFAAGATAAFLLTGTPPGEHYDMGDDTLRVRGKTGASNHLESVIEEMTNRGGSGYASAAEAKRALAETGANPIAGRNQAGAGMDDTGTNVGATTIDVSADAPRRRPSARMYMAAASVVAAVGLAALGFNMMNEPDGNEAGVNDRGTAEGLGDLEEVAGAALTAVPDGPLPLDAIARAATDAELLIEIQYPVTWLIVSQPTDSHVAVRDPVTGAVFLAGIEVVAGPDLPARVFVDQWASVTVAPYARVSVVSSEPPTDGTYAYRLDVMQGSQAVREGVIAVTSFTEVEAGLTMFRWWAALNHGEATATTIQAMAESLEVRPVGS